MTRESCTRRTVPILAALIAWLAVQTMTASDLTREQEDFFERSVRPVLVEHCIECHGAETQESGLRLDSRAAWLRGGERGPAIAPGEVDQSLLVRALRHDGELRMPPSGRLKAVEIAGIERWIQQGARWPTGEAVLAPDAGQSARLDRLRALRDQHWAFQPVRKPVVPQGKTSWPRNPLDHFVLARMQVHELSPADEADRRTLIRRVAYDLVGLPPPPSLVEVFSADPAADWYERLVEHLLKQPTYGEHWARHWLDVARYADTTGYQEGGERLVPFAWTYRDYVVRSLNEDTPFNEFIVEQLAADRLELSDEKNWKLAAMGFLTLGPRFNYARHEIIDDRIDVLSRGLLGLTVSCARCHDHKYDPVLAEDYYSLYGVLASSQEPLYTDLPRIGASQGDFGRYREFRTQAARATRRFEQFHARVHRTIQQELRAQVGDYLRYLVQLMPEHRTVVQPSFETERGRIRGPTPYGPGAIVRWQHYISQCGTDDPVFGVWNRLAKLSRQEFSADQIAALIQQAEGINPLLRAALIEARPRSMIDVASVYGEVLERTSAEWTTWRETNAEAQKLPDKNAEQLRQVLDAADSPLAMSQDAAHDCYADGEFNQYMGLKRELDALFVKYQDVAAPRAMVLVDRPEPQEPRLFERGNSNRPGEWVERRFFRFLEPAVGVSQFKSGSGRLELARGIADPHNPLTARVIVNRVWHWHFGRGLVDTPSDFGTRAETPSHPELLDWLAADFMEHGWSLKRLHQQIVTSATYRQSSFVSRESFEKDPDNRLLSRMNRRRLEFEALRDSLLAVAERLDLSIGGPPVDELGSPRRSLYLLVNRDDPRGVLATFDFPSPDLSADKRAETTVPQQALFLMNSGFTTNVVTRLVGNLLDETSADTAVERVEWLYRRVLGRRPTSQELTLAVKHVEPGFDAANGGAPSSTTRTEDRWQELAQVLLMSNEFAFVD